MSTYMRHWNNKPLVAINIETNGPDFIYHDIIQVAAIALTATLDVDREIIPIELNIAPTNPEFYQGRLNRSTYTNILSSAFDSLKAADLFETWLNKFTTKTDFGTNRPVQLLSFNYHLKAPFLIKWLTWEVYKELFDETVRDLASMGHYLNDRANIKGNTVPYSKQILPWMVSKHGIEFTIRKNCLEECRVMGELYKAMMKSGTVLY